MSEPIVLSPHGEHSVEYTEQVAGAISEAVRVLNYATGEYAEDGLPYPSTAYSVLGNLAAAAGGLDQLARQIGDRLAALAADDQLTVRSGQYAGRPVDAAAAAVSALQQVRRAADGLYEALSAAQSAIGEIGMRHVPDQDEEES